MTRHYREIEDYTLPYIAKIRADRANSSVVVYNPDICERIGAACGFFRTHAYAHLVLNHTPFLRPDEYPTGVEDEADCWAAKHAAPEEVRVVVELLRDEQALKDLPVTGEPARRAEHIETCAGQADSRGSG